ncbi:type IV pilus modification protein PilV [Ectothiorhodospiraceae bacterium 2226]|nr:type IV pilus modification protein PilV [Ectothiorhodospiraceae bacterium 2226]
MRMRGFTLIEILVALLVVALGILGIAGLQVRAQQSALEAQQRTQALMIVEDMVERMRSVGRSFAPCHAEALGDNTLGAGNDDDYTCTWGGDLRHHVTTNLAEWDALLKGAAVQTEDDNDAGAMVGARGCIRYDDATEEYTVAVAWQGMLPTAVPDDECATGAYGDDDRLRRVVSYRFRIAHLD